MRTFIAVEIPADIRKQVTVLVDEQKTKALPVKWVAFENLHITVKFLGEIDEDMKEKTAGVLQDVCQRHQRFSVGFSGIGCFPDPSRPRVVWIGIDTGADHLSALAHAVDEQLVSFGFKKEKRFHPHLTIGRIKKPCRIDGILGTEFTTQPFLVQRLTLFKSTLTPQGAVYDSLGIFDLSE
jgi:2'-5' RNA ligase